MTRVVTTALVLAAVAAAVLVARDGIDFNTGPEPYRVRAIFDSAASVISGEDVKVAGVKVGTVDGLDVTPDNKAAITLRIDKPGFTDFRRDAHCMVRPQSLIGEKFVECELTQPRAAGTAAPPPLRTLTDGPGTGHKLLPLQNTSASVDIDELNNIMRRPYAERLSLIINEFGTGLAGRGGDLNAAIRRATPALQQTDEVLKILAGQNEELADLAVNGDKVVAPLARDRKRLSSFIDNAGEVAEATADRRADLSRTIERLPAFLSELRPTMERLGALSDQMTPVVSDLGAAAPDLNRFLLELGPFSEASRPAFRTLGEAAEAGLPAVREARPVVSDLRTFARRGRPVVGNLAATLGSLQRTGGIESALNFVFYGGTATNSYDGLGHYLRAAAVLQNSTCVEYAFERSRNAQGACSANWRKPRTRLPEEPETSRPGQSGSRPGQSGSRPGQSGSPESSGSARAAPAPAKADAAGSAAPGPSKAQTGVLDYLLGG